VAERAVKSGVWASAITASDRVLQIVKLVVVAGLLGPSAMGLMGIALLTLATLDVFTNLGMDVALIQRSEDDVDAYLDTAWVLQLCRGAALAAVAWTAAPFVATFFGEPRSLDLIRVIGFSPLLLGLQNPAVMYFRKNLEFHRQFGYRVTGSLVDMSVALALAVATGSVWALVFGKLAGDATRTGASYVIHDYRPSVAFDLAKGRELFGYGKWILGAGVTSFLLGQGDDVFVGWFLGAASLGLYQLAYRLANAPATEITKVISSTMLPTYSKLQDDPAAVREAYFRVLQFTTLLTFPMSVGIFVTAPSFVAAFLGDAWAPMVPVMRALSAWGLLLSIGANVGPLFRALGRPDHFGTAGELPRAPSRRRHRPPVRPDARLSGADEPRHGWRGHRRGAVDKSRPRPGVRRPRRDRRRGLRRRPAGGRDPDRLRYRVDAPAHPAQPRLTAVAPLYSAGSRSMTT